MSDKPVLDQLSHLVAVNKDAEAGYRAAAKSVMNSEIETLFDGYASRHATFAAEIQDEIERRGERLSDSGNLTDSVHRGWMNLKALVTGHSVSSTLSTCENEEQSTESAYLDSLEIITSGKAHILLNKQCEEIKGFRTRLARLVGEMKDGIDFQSNE
jgi:uncharacterized protein (TIGR02284 family)